MNEKGLIGTACTAAIVRNAVKVSLVVGTILNVLNQGPALIEGQPLAISQLLVNYLVPYLVSSYSAARNEIDRRKRSSGAPGRAGEVPGAISE